MAEQPTRSHRWRQFVIIAVACLAVEQVVGWVVWREPFTTRLVPAIFGALGAAAGITFLARRRS